MRGPFDYRLRADQPEVEVGSLLRVPFGGRRSLGVVVALSDRSELAPERLVEPDAVLPDGLPADLVALALWMAGEYCSTPARALGLLLAPGSGGGVKARQVLVARLTEEGRRAVIGDEPPRSSDARPLTPRQRQILATLERAGEMPASTAGSLDSVRRLERRGLVELSSQADTSAAGGAQDRRGDGGRSAADARSAGGSGSDSRRPGRGANVVVSCSTG